MVSRRDLTLHPYGRPSKDGPGDVYAAKSLETPPVWSRDAEMEPSWSRSRRMSESRSRSHRELFIRSRRVCVISRMPLRAGTGARVVTIFSRLRILGRVVSGQICPSCDISSLRFEMTTRIFRAMLKKVRSCKLAIRGSATPMKMGGGGGRDQAAAKPGFSSEDNPYQKPKTQWIWPTIFLKMGGLSSSVSKMGGRVPPPFPVWRSPC